MLQNRNMNKKNDLIKTDKQMFVDITNVNQQRITLKQEDKIAAKALSSGLNTKNYVNTVEKYGNDEIINEEMENIAEQINNLSVMSVEEMFKDYDAQNIEDPFLVSEYASNIYKYLRRKEVREKINVDYMATVQTDINQKIRAILIDWLVQVHQRFMLSSETLYLTVQIIDKYLSKVKVLKSEVQLIGVTALFLASKYEDIFFPEINDISSITDNAFSIKQIRQTERKLVHVLDFTIDSPFSLQFLRRLSTVSECSTTVHSMSKYFLELSLNDYQSIFHMPSLLAASAFYIAINLLEYSEWNKEIEFYSGYSEASLKQCVRYLLDIHLKYSSSRIQAVKKKYSDNSFDKISEHHSLGSTKFHLLYNSFKL